MLTLHVATDAPQFRVELHRYGGDGMRLQQESGWLPGRDAPQHLPFDDWGEPGVGLDGEPLSPWPAYRIGLPPQLRPGVYVAVLVEGDGAGGDRTDPDRTTPDGRDARALFVVRPPRGRPAAPILYKIPLLTYHAYDVVDGNHYDPGTRTGHWCLYSVPRAREVPRPFPPTMSLHRPGGGTGGVPYDTVNVDPFDPTPRQTFVHWDARFVGWLEREGYDVDYCTDVDLHRDGRALLDPHRLLLSAGHDEYWSDAMRAAVEGFVAGGGNAAFFGGNTCWWRVVFADDVTFSREHFWSAAECPGEPENTMTGVSFRNGGERDGDDHPVPVGFRVQHADHWVYAGTGLRDGDTFGDGPEEYLVGYECDGAHVDRASLDGPEPVEPTFTDGTPSGFTILGLGDVGRHGWGVGSGVATMGLFTHPGTADGGTGGTVFNGATTDWPRVLTAGTTPAVEQITRTVVDRLGGPAGGTGRR